VESLLQHLRIARPVSNLQRSESIYCHGLGLVILGRFVNHDGFDGVILGCSDVDYHFEFTACGAHPVIPSPTVEDLVVLYLPLRIEWERRCAAMLAAGFETVMSFNPYWDRMGRTFVDQDGYRTVLQNASWKPELAG
jgi:hypothetical protein